MSKANTEASALAAAPLPGAPARTANAAAATPREVEPVHKPTVQNVMPHPPAMDSNSSHSEPLDGILGTRPECLYIKKKLLGQGSFGSAWRVEERATGNTYAAKVMDTNAMTPKDRGFVTNEVKCLSRCNNPNIIRHCRSFEKEGMLLIIMEFADGGDLYKQIKARQPQMRYFKEHEILFIFLQLCLALDHIHMNKMMHRDLKTANILLMTTGLVKLGDFGFSRQYEDSLSKPVGSTFCGTPYYLSPELWRRAPYSKKSEMWALGVILYEVIALKRPFTGRNMDELIDNILNARRPKLPPQYSPELRDVCDQLLALDPASRPTVRQLFQQPFIRKSLETLRYSVERHTRIPQNIRNEIAQNVTEALSDDLPDYEGNRITPMMGVVKRHTTEHGWQDCELSLNQGFIKMKDMSGKVDGGAPEAEEVVQLNAVTSVCPIDATIANEDFVFAMKDQTGKAFWFRECDAEAFNRWVSALQSAIS